jgi:predicted metal-dependent HD superfamily phosphohydrolase
VEELLRAQWQAAVGPGRDGTSLASDHFERLLARYREPHRRYHTVTHLAAVLSAAEDLMAQIVVSDHEAVRLALFFHDAVYDPRSDTNEADSAVLARAVLSELDVPAARVNAVAALVMATRHQTPSPVEGEPSPLAAAAHDPGDGDTAVVLDSDLAVLAAEPSRYEAYARGVRAEYTQVDDAGWRAGRAAVLRAFLDRPAIYLTAPMRSQEHRARANLAAELSALL